MNLELKKSELQAKLLYKPNIIRPSKYFEEIIYENSDSYIGEILNGLREGFGIYTSENGDIYEGFWVENLQQGEGILTLIDGIQYKGEWKEGKPNGKGIFLPAKIQRNSFENYKLKSIINNEDNSSDQLLTKMNKHFQESEELYYDGYWRDGKHEGTGTCQYCNGDLYEGSWELGKLNGSGIFLNLFFFL